jgi:hypothetical protein
MQAGQGDPLAGEVAGEGSALEPPAFLMQAVTKKPLWVGVQSYRKPGTQGRYPTPAEYRAQAFAAVCSGARGLMWYGGSVHGGMFLDVNAGRWDELQTIIRELRDLSPFLLAPAAAPPVIRPEGAPISATIRTASGKTLLIAVNRSLRPIDIVFNSPSIPNGSALVRGEQRTVSVSLDALQDRFEPLAVHVYEFAAVAPSP